MGMTAKEKNDATAKRKADKLAKGGTAAKAKQRRRATHCGEGAAALGLCTPMTPSRQQNPPQYGPSGQSNDDD